MILRLIVCLIVFVNVTGCVTSPPQKLENICSIFDEKRGWYKAAKKAKKRWGIPIATNMAIMHQESRFVAKAKPPRKKFLWIFPGRRASNAFGYSQAKKETWGDYQRAIKRRGADRDKFKDAIDFIGWYNHLTTKRNRVKVDNTYGLYLAYHEGHGGFTRASYKAKPWLMKVAKKVQSRANTYSAQLKKCERRLSASGWWFF